MENIKIIQNKEQCQTKFFITSFYDSLVNNKYLFLLATNFLITFYLLYQNYQNNFLIKEILKSNSFNNKRKINYSEVSEDIYTKKYIIDKDMIGLKYPEIHFDTIIKDYLNGKLVPSFCTFLNQLETKLIYLEKEINITKLFTFYTSRKLYLDRKNVSYDDANIKEFHEVISWLVIHKSTQLQGIASDKYLACKYVELKINKNLCSHRIAVYNSIEEIDFDNIVKMGNVILKVTNGCHDNVDISKNSDISKIKKDISYHFNRDYALINPEFFHLYSKKRIILEKKFIPLDDLYEFKFLIMNHEVKLIIIRYNRNEKFAGCLYDNNFNPIKINGKTNLDLKLFKNNNLNEIKSLALTLSEDFPNFIRVDLYLFHDEIYLSELTFDPYDGIPQPNIKKILFEVVRNWKKIDY